MSGGPGYRAENALVKIAFRGCEGNSIGGKIVVIGSQDMGVCVAVYEHHCARIGKIHTRSPFFHQRKHVIGFGGDNLHAGCEPAQLCQCRRMIVDQMAGFDNRGISDIKMRIDTKQGLGCPSIGFLAGIEHRY